MFISMEKNVKSRNSLSRREFLGWAWGVSLIGLFGQAGAALVSFFKPRVEPGSFGSKVIAGQFNEFQIGTVSHIPKGRVFIFCL